MINFPYIIRLKRVGRWKKPVYHIVIALKNKAVSGGFLEKLGFYSPAAENQLFFVSLSRLAFWLMRGAKMTPKVGLLIGKLAYTNKHKFVSYFKVYKNYE